MSTRGDQLEKEANAVTEDLQTMGAAVRNNAHEKLGQLREHASECCEQGLDRMRRVKHNAGQFVGKLPIKSVLIAAVVGFLLGCLWPRR